MPSAGGPRDREIVETPTVVIGAGPSGLAVSACLHVAGLPHVVLDREQQLGSSWRRHYERLHLHTIRDESHLPYLPYPRSYPRYPSRAQVVAYLESYAREFGIEPRLGQAVASARHEDGRWSVAVRGGPLYRADALVVATGYNGVPYRPSWPGQEQFAGELLHSSQYSNGARFSGTRALVVGIGNSGGEIAIDLHESGATTTMCVRSPIHITPRDLHGIPAQRTGIAVSRLPVRVGDAIARIAQRLNYGDLSRYGLRTPETGALTELLSRGRVPLIDIGTVGLIKRGAITVIGAIERFDEGGVWVDGAHHPFDVVVLATGYRAALHRFLEGAEGLTNEHGYPRAHGREAAVRGLYFIGFSNPPTGALREITIEAQRIAGAIARASAA